MIRRSFAWLAPVALALVPLLHWGEDLRFTRIAFISLTACIAWATRPLGTKPAPLAALFAAGPLLAGVSWLMNDLSPLGVSAILEITAWLCATWVIVLDERPTDYALAWIAAISAAALFGLAQALHVFPMPLDAYGQPDPAATFGLSNFAGEVLAVTLPLTVAVFVRTRHQVLRTLLPGALLAQTAYLLVSGSRAGWLGLTAALVTALALWRPADKRAWMGAALATLVFVGAFVVAGGSRLRLLSPDDPSISFRREAWSATLRMAADQPTFGVGPGRFAAHIATYGTERLMSLSYRARRSVSHPHNEFLAALAERGVPGVAWLLAMLGIAVVALWRAGAAWALGAVAAGAVTAVFGFPLQQAPFWAALAIAVAYGLNARGDQAGDDPTPRAAGSLGPRMAIFFLTGMVAFFGVRADASHHARRGAHLLENARRVGAHDVEKAELLRAQAGEELKAALESWPYDPEALFNRAAAASIGDDKIAALQKYLAYMPGDLLARVTLAHYQAEAGQPQAAEETLQLLLLEKNAPPEACHRLIGLYVSANKFDAAIRTAEEGLARFPGNPQLMIDAGDAFRLQGDHAGAVARYEAALPQQEDEPGLFLRAGISNMALGRYVRAEEMFRAGHKLSPRNTQFLVYLARLEFASDRVIDAKAHLLAALKYDPNLANNLQEAAPELQSLVKELQ